jgi:hypothetical protein
VSREKQITSNPFFKLWHWLRDQIIQTVPEDSAICEFDCRKEQCTMDEWETCERRITKAAGELMPAPKKETPAPNGSSE